MTDNLFIYGAEKPPTPPIRLQTGAIDAEFEPDTGQLRYVRVSGIEVLRGVYGAVRDGHWGTPQPAFSNLKVDRSSEGFSLSVDAYINTEAIEFRWQIRVSGRADALEYVFDGEVLRDFRTNRTGLCILHPPSVAGLPCVITHSDGREEAGQFPDLISPDQPFFDIRAISHSPTPGLTVEVAMVGEIFEMEDQRNWTDASYKTYCRPQALPKPYPLSAGEKVVHKVRVSATSENGRLRPAPESFGVSLRIAGGDPYPLPSLGTVFGLDRDEERDLELGELGLGHYYILGEAEDGVRPVTILYPDFGEGQAFVAPPEAAREGVGVASRDNFTELNRTRPGFRVPALLFAMNPQVHAFDTRTLMETLPIQAECIRTARSFHSGPVHAGPLTLGRPADPRLNSLVTVGWVLGSIAALTRAGAASATYFDVPSLLGSPASVVFRDLAGADAAYLTSVSDSLAIAALTVSGEQGRRTLVANLTAEHQHISLPLAAPYDRPRLRTLAFNRTLAPAPFEVEDQTLMFDLSPHAYGVVEWQ